MCQDEFLQARTRRAFFLAKTKSHRYDRSEQRIFIKAFNLQVCHDKLVMGQSSLSIMQLDDPSTIAATATEFSCKVARVLQEKIAQKFCYLLVNVLFCCKLATETADLKKPRMTHARRPNDARELMNCINGGKMCTSPAN